MCESPSLLFQRQRKPPRTRWHFGSRWMVFMATQLRDCHLRTQTLLLPTDQSTYTGSFRMFNHTFGFFALGARLLAIGSLLSFSQHAHSQCGESSTAVPLAPVTE